MCKTFTPEVDGEKYTVVQGTNRHENWALLDSSDPSDIWFHASNTSSAYVMLHAPASGLLPPSLVAFCSSLIDSKEIVYTKCGNLKKGKAKGMAIVLDETLVAMHRQKGGGQTLLSAKAEESKNEDKSQKKDPSLKSD